MSKKLEILNTKAPYWLILIICFIFLILLLFPLFYIAKYNVPSADDFSFSCETHAAISEGNTIFGIITAAIYKVKDVYYSWQGTFSAVFMMAFQPSIWGFRYYFLTTWIMVISLLAGIFFLFLRLFSGIFHIKKSLAGIIAVVTSIICIQFVPTANQSFFWYNGSIYYTFTFGVLLILYAINIGFILYGGYWRLALICIFSIFIGGNNYVTALIYFIVTFCIILFLFIKRDDRALYICLPFILFLISFLISATAPGNAVRQEKAAERLGIIQSILLSFKYASINSLKWTDLRLSSCIIFLFPFIWLAAKSSNKTFPYPLLFSLLSFCVFSASFTPHLYALASDGPDRLKNIIFFFYVLLIVFNLFWWCGWLTHRRKDFQTSQSDSIRILPFTLFSGASFICLIFAVFLFHSSLTSVLAINELRSGEAQSYYEEALQRQSVLEDATIQDCEFEPFESMPYLLFFTDMSDDPSDFQNEDTCTYYHKNTIIVR